MVLLVGQPSPPLAPGTQRPVARTACLLNDEPILIYAPLLMRPRSCRLAISQLPATWELERFYWWIGMSICARWWLRNYLKCQARKTSRLTVRWPIITIPSPDGPGIAVSIDYFGPLPVTPRGNAYILLFTDRSSRRAGMIAVTNGLVRR